MRMNEHKQPIGEALPDWKEPPRIHHQPIVGARCRLEPLEERHAEGLHEANCLDPSGRAWTYQPYGPFEALRDFERWVGDASKSHDTQFYAVVLNESDKPVGVASYLNMDSNNGVVEVGHVQFSPLLQRSAASTEALFVMIDHVFGLGYRRCEWKCDSLNQPSVAAAERLGFVFEGTFRNARVYKGRSRDSSWFSIIDREWPALKARIGQWLDPSNFHTDGSQISSLSQIGTAT